MNKIITLRFRFLFPMIWATLLCNGKDRVGINIDKPRASLDVDGSVTIEDGYYAYMNGTGDPNGIGLCKFCDPRSLLSPLMEFMQQNLMLSRRYA